jgi:predicted transcriptional regulator
LSFEKLFELVRRVWGGDVKFQIVRVLCEREGCSLREVARLVGMHPSSVAKHLEELCERGVVEFFKPNLNTKVFRLAREYEVLREHFKRA